MTRYKIHRMKESPREHFRWAPHTGGLATVKAKDYEPGGEVEALSPYALWKRLAEENGGKEAIAPGDVLEAAGAEGTGPLLIAKYIGFEPAQWWVPETKSEGKDASSAVEAAEHQTAALAES